MRTRKQAGIAKTLGGEGEVAQDHRYAENAVRRDRFRIAILHSSSSSSF